MIKNMMPPRLRRYLENCAIAPLAALIAYFMGKCS